MLGEAVRIKHVKGGAAPYLGRTERAAKEESGEGELSGLRTGLHFDRAEQIGYPLFHVQLPYGHFPFNHLSDSRECVLVYNPGAMPRLPSAPHAPVPKSVPQLPLPSKFPASGKRRAEIVGEVARAVESREGKFHAAGIWRELHTSYGDSVLRDRIYIEKWIGDWLRENAQFAGSYRNANYYKFERGT